MSNKIEIINNPLICDGCGEKKKVVGWKVNVRRLDKIHMLQVCDRKLSSGECTLGSTERPSCKLGRVVLNRAAYDKNIAELTAPVTNKWTRG